MPALIEIRTADYDEVAPLFVELDRDLDERYGGGEPVRFHREEFDPPHGRLVVAVGTGGGADPLLGCTGVRPLPAHDGVAELKRMFVRSGARQRGVARALLAAGEQAARELGYHALWLETGLRQPEAVALYRSAGYTGVERFGQYAHEPESVYLGRDL